MFPVSRLQLDDREVFFYFYFLGQQTATIGMEVLVGCEGKYIELPTTIPPPLGIYVVLPS